MEEKSKCPYWDEKEGRCTLETHIAEVPMGGAILGGRLQALENLASKIFHPPSDSKGAFFGEDEEWKEKQEYWEKELDEMDEEKKK